ncbi:MAG: T9SS type A sorting domain-containing protein [Bacteroidota bacterium]
MKKLFTFLFIAFALTSSAQLISVSPNSGYRGQTLTVTVTGQGTRFTTANVNSLGFYQGTVITTGLTINSVHAISNTILEINITINASNNTGLYKLSIDDGYLSLITLNSAFQVNLPNLSYVTPNYAVRGQTLNVSITGVNTNFTQGSSLAVTFSQGSSTLLVNSVTPITNTTLTANITINPNSLFGMYSLTVNDPLAGSITKGLAFSVNAPPTPSLTLITPAKIYSAQTLNITITGINTHFTQGSTSVNFFYQGSPTSTVVVNSLIKSNDTTLVCNTTFNSSAVNGNYDVRVNNSIDGLLTLPAAFRIATGIDETQNNFSSIHIYPNPANDLINISFEQQSSAVTISIFDMTGRLSKSVNTNKNNTLMNVSDLENGIYFIAISGKDFTASRKLIINK